MNLGGKVRSALRWMFIGRILAQVLTWASTLAVIRLLTPQDYGVMAMSQVLVALLFALSYTGVADSLIHNRSASEQSSRQIFGVLIVLSFLLGAVQFLAGPILAWYFEDPRVEPVAQALAVNFFLLPWVSLPNALLARDLEFKWTSIVEMIAAITAALVSIAVAWAGFGVWALVAAMLSKTLTQVVGLAIARPIGFLPRFSVKGIDAELRFGLQVSLGAFLSSLYKVMDVIIGGRLLSSTQIGLYATGLQLASLPMVKVMPIVNQVAFPSYVQIQEHPERVGKHVQQSIGLASALTFPIFLGVATIAPEFVDLVLGEKWSELTPCITLLALSMPIRVAANLLFPALRALGHTIHEVRYCALNVVLLGLGFAIGSQWGPTGLAATWLIVSPIAFLFTLFSAASLLHIRAPELLRHILPSALAATIMLSVTRLLVEPQIAHFGLIAELILLVLTGALIFGLAMLLLFPSYTRSLKRQFLHYSKA